MTDLPQKPVHVPVLLQTVTELLAPQRGNVYVDCTAGLGGHALAIGRRLGEVGGGVVILNDMDPANLARAKENVARACAEFAGVGVTAIQGEKSGIGGNFVDVPRKLERVRTRADMVLADLGFASNHVDDGARGFSFMHDGPLDMRMDPSIKLSAADLVNQSSAAELEGILREFGEENHAARIARKVVQERKESPILTTGRLSAIVRSSVPNANASRIHPATRTFQALRIAVNDELGSLQALLAAIEDGARAVKSGKQTWVRPGARIAIITFHSLEDRPVKECFGRLIKEGLAQDVSGGARGPTEAEEEANPRARSAKVRVVKVGG